MNMETLVPGMRSVKSSVLEFTKERIILVEKKKIKLVAELS